MNKGSTIEQIQKKIRLLNLSVATVVITLVGIILYEFYLPSTFLSAFLPVASISIIIGLTMILSGIGLYLSLLLSRQTFKSITDYRSRLQQILSITNDMREEVHADLLLDKIMDSALSITESEAGSVLLMEKEGQLTFRIVKGEKGGSLLNTSLEKGQGITGWVAEHGELICLEDVSKDERFNPKIDAVTGFVTRSILCVPMKIRSNVIGVIELLNKKNGSYTKQDEEILSFFADQAAGSIIKTRFIEDQRNYEIHVTDMLLEAIDFHIPEKAGHSRRVAQYSNIIAKGLNMPENERKRLYLTALLHDVGFLKIRAEDSFKEEKYRQHSVIGHEMIKPINFYADIAPFILHHHERFDGFGYPAGLKGTEIPLESRIIALAEAFDSMVSKVTYKVPVNYEEASEELLRRAGAQFDPELVEIFLGAITSEFIEKVI